MRALEFVKKLPSRMIIAAIKLYRIMISPLIGARCRFYPSCSEYFMQAVEKKGMVKGMAIGIFRIARCNPFNPGGYDPIK